MSVASAPEDLTLFLNEETVSNFENTVPVYAQSEINVKHPSRKQKPSEKGKTGIQPSEILKENWTTLGN